VVAGMCAHVGAAGVQEQGCAALDRICHDNVDNRAKVVALGGIEVVERASAAHPSNPRVQEFALHVLKQLA